MLVQHSGSAMFKPQEIQSIVEHMNEDHADAVLSYARAFTSFDTITAATMHSIDASGIDIECSHVSGQSKARIPFAAPLSSSGEARTALVDLVKTSRTIEQLSQLYEKPYQPVDCGAYDYLEIACTYHYALKLDLIDALTLTGKAQTLNTVKDQGEFLLVEVNSALIKVRLDTIIQITALDDDARFGTQVIAAVSGESAV